MTALHWHVRSLFTWELKCPFPSPLWFAGWSKSSIPLLPLHNPLYGGWEVLELKPVDIYDRRFLFFVGNLSILMCDVSPCTKLFEHPVLLEDCTSLTWKSIHLVFIFQEFPVALAKTVFPEVDDRWNFIFTILFIQFVFFQINLPDNLVQVFGKSEGIYIMGSFSQVIFYWKKNWIPD